MNNIITTFFLIMLHMAALAEPVYACSLAPDHLRTSNYEMVRNTELIILAKAESVTPLEKNTDPEDSSNQPKVRFSVLEVVKGDFSKRTVDIFGSANEYHGRSDAGDFSQVRPGAMRGACNANDYKIGAKFLLFLKNHDGNWYASGNAFSRINEEVSSHSSPWALAVKRYVQINQLDDYEKEKTELKKIIALKKQPNETQAMISDIENHLKTPSIDKSIKDLKEIFEQTQEQKALWAMTKSPRQVINAFF